MLTRAVGIRGAGGGGDLTLLNEDYLLEGLYKRSHAAPLI